MKKFLKVIAVFFVILFILLVVFYYPSPRMCMFRYAFFCNTNKLENVVACVTPKNSKEYNDLLEEELNYLQDEYFSVEKVSIIDFKITEEESSYAKSYITIKVEYLYMGVKCENEFTGELWFECEKDPFFMIDKWTLSSLPKFDLVTKEVYNEVVKCTLLFDSDNGEEIIEYKVYLGDKLVEEYIPEKEGSLFLGWYYEKKDFFNGEIKEVLFDQNDEIYENLSLKAKWLDVSNLNYDIKFKNNSYIVDEVDKNIEEFKFEIPRNNFKLKYIEKNAFQDCKSLRKIIIPNTVTYIGKNAFINCNNLKDVYFEGSFEEWLSIYFVNNASNPMFYAENLYLMDKQGEYFNINEVSWYDAGGGTSINYIGINDATIVPIFGRISNVRARWKNVILADNLIKIVQDSFVGCPFLESITIPSSVKEIGSCAFDCPSLTNVYYTGTIEDWCNILFEDDGANPMCYARNFYMLNANNEYYEVTNITIPDAITEVGKNQFSGFNNLTSITIPNSVTSIGDSAFARCSSLKNVYFNGTIEDWCNIKFSNKTSNPMYYASDIYMLDEYNNYYKVTNIEIPNTITMIGENQFFGFENISSVIISKNVTTIKERSFENCFSLKYVVIHSNTETIQEYAFKNCSALTHIVFEADSKLSVIEEYVFSDCTSLTNIAIPNGVTSIGGSAFYNCTSLADIKIPNNVTSIESMAFYNCTSLTNITFEEGSKLATIGIRSFENCKSLTNIKIPDSVTSIGRSAFGGCSKLYYIKNDSSLDLSSLTGIIFPGCYDFQIINKSGSIVQKQSNYIITEDRFVFELVNKKYTLVAYIGVEKTITLPNSINGHNYDIYLHFEGDSIIIPSNITNIGKQAFDQCLSLINITFEEGSKLTTIGESAFKNCKYLTNIKIPNGVTTIGESAFENCESLTNIKIPDSVTIIGESAFENCRSLTNITFEEGSKLTTIGDGAFENCSSLTNITFEEGSKLTTIGESAFKNCESLTNIKIPDGVTTIGGSAFENCKSLTNVKIPDSVTSIGNSAFHYCKSLTNVNISNSVTNISDLMFASCSSLTNIKIPDSVTSIGNSAFGACSALQIVTFEEGSKLTTIGDSAFYNCRSLESIIIPSTVEIIKSYAFGYCTSLENVIIETNSKMRELGDGAFSDCKSLEKITIPQGIKIICEDTFSGCISLNVMEIPFNIEKIEENAFYNCVNLYKVINKSNIVIISGSTENGEVALYANIVVN